MGVIYKLTDEVVQFIISQRQHNPLASCRELAESASEKFGVHLSKSSVHDVLKDSGIITPRGRKPRNKFEIPQEKKKQIQVNFSQVKLLPGPIEHKALPIILSETKPALPIGADLKAPVDSPPLELKMPNNEERAAQVLPKEDTEESSEYPEAGKIFLKAALWDLGIFSESSIKGADWVYYLTYSKGIRIVLENDKSFFIDLPLPLERCIKEAADGIVNNVKPFVAYKVSDEELFKACMEAQQGFGINKVIIVDYDNRVLLEFSNIVEYKREFMIKNRVFMESNEIEALKRAKALFFHQVIDNDDVIENILNLKGMNHITKGENTITLFINGNYENKSIIEEAAGTLNGMYLRDEKDRLVTVNIEVRA